MWKYCFIEQLHNLFKKKEKKENKGEIERNTK